MVVVTGAAGAVGSRVVRRLVHDHEGIDVRAVDKATVDAQPGLDVKRVDLASDDLTSVFAGATSIVHLATAVTPDVDDPSADELELAIVSRVLDAAAEIAPMALAYGFGHVGDGNLHMMILPITDETVEPWLEVRDQMTAEIDRLVFELDGTLSAEHGVGLLLRDRVGPQKSDIEWEMMRTVKRALDPQNLFNPGKLIPLAD